MSALELAPAVFLAGILMFLAPCTLPIVPAYIAYIGGAAAGGAGSRRRIFQNALLFCIGFSAVFIILGAGAGLLGAALAPWREVLARAAGLILILFGAVLLGARIPMLSGDLRARVPARLSVGQPGSSLFIGALFALGWSPCIGPVLGGALFLAASSATAASGAALLTIFCAGFSIPFLLTALFLGEAAQWLQRFERAAKALQFTAGAILAALGVLMALGQANLLITWGYNIFGFLQYGVLLNYL